MIGQKNNLEIIKRWRLNRNTPRFILISGEGERLDLAKEIAKSMSADIVIVNKSVADVRQVIDNSYRVSKTTFYIFENGNEMSIAANNAILKITEEPPNNAYFIMLCETSTSVLETIVNRSTQLYMDFYTKEELQEITDNEKILLYCREPVSVRTVVANEDKFNKLVQHAEKFANDLPTISGVDCLKITTELYNDKESPFSLELFIEIVATNLAGKDLGLGDDGWYTKMKIIQTCDAAINDLKKSGIKKDSTLDLWALEMRGIFQ